MVKTLSELRRENARLKAEREVRSNILKRNVERRKLMTENRRLRNPRTFGFIQKTGEAIKRTTKTTSKGIKVVIRDAVKFEKDMARKEALSKKRMRRKTKRKRRRKR